jgi:tetraacyldisaccharide 4'-kinase
MKTRESLYHKGWKKRYKLDVPVISVGNLTMGGTGKTPLVAMLAKQLQKQGMRPAIISRGYGGAAGNKVNVVSDGNTVLMDPKEAGDEPCFLASTLPGVPVLTGIVRILPCRHAIAKLNCNVLILDDGFQHMSVKRDLDLVLFNAASLAGNSRVFPGGDLREPISALNRCHAFVITGTTEKLREQAGKFAKLLKERFPEKPVFICSYNVVGARSLNDQSFHKLSDLPTPLFAFCGIAQPDLFQETLTANDVDVAGFMALRDHQAFIPSLLQKIGKQAIKSSAKGLITTEKDLVKLSLNDLPLPCFSLQMDVHHEQDFENFITQSITGLLPSN